jgi:quercetin dioxygenase-like cupin family protein
MRVVRIGFLSVMGLVLAIAMLVPGGERFSVVSAGADGVGERVLLDNERVTLIEFVFPAGFRGEEHAAVADEFAYVLAGEFAVVTKGKGKRVLRAGDVEYAAKYTVHSSLNETARPARVLVVLLKDR